MTVDWPVESETGWSGWLLEAGDTIGDPQAGRCRRCDLGWCGGGPVGPAVAQLMMRGG